LVGRNPMDQFTQNRSMDQKADLVCFSHLRWNFVFQRPQHLMSRFARQRRVFYVEEPIFEEASSPEARTWICPETGVHIVTMHLPQRLGASWPTAAQALVQELYDANDIHDPISWFYTPMALDYFPATLGSSLIVYDCMDELSGFAGADPRLHENEEKLMKAAHVVFTGGVSLFEAKRAHCRRAYPFPSGVDMKHFAKARSIPNGNDPEDQAAIPRPRLGFAGVIDERMDLDLVAKAAALKPDWSWVMLGPVAKIDPASLPQAPNLHWLGMKAYKDLPAYFHGWKVGLMPFALNDATRFISPTKTPEYLAAGLPVVSTPIRDVVRPYGELGLARIAATPADFVVACDEAMKSGMGLKWRERVDEYLKTVSWDSVWEGMNRMISSSPTARPATDGQIGSRSSGGEALRV
jgi:glycosyltransferase involved in cell wall biosynthesis